MKYLKNLGSKYVEPALNHEMVPDLKSRSPRFNSRLGWIVCFYISSLSRTRNKVIVRIYKVVKAFVAIWYLKLFWKAVRSKMEMAVEYQIYIYPTCTTDILLFPDSRRSIIKYRSRAMPWGLGFRALVILFYNTRQSSVTSYNEDQKHSQQLYYINIDCTKGYVILSCSQ